MKYVRYDSWWVLKPWRWGARLGLWKLPDGAFAVGPSQVKGKPITLIMFFPANNKVVWGLDYTLESAKKIHADLGHLIDQMETFRKD